MDLDNIRKIQKLDKKNINSSLMHFIDQCKQGWTEASNLPLNYSYKDLNHIITCAMGGSLLGARILRHVFHQDIKIPFNYYAQYNIPGYVNDKTLAIIISNSGNTEETLSAYDQAKKITNKIIGITKGGKLGPLCKKDGFPVYLIDDRDLNPSSVPRVAVGFQIGAITAILNKINLIPIPEKRFFNILNKVKKQLKPLYPEVKSNSNPAKQSAEKTFGKIPIIISSQHLTGVGKSINNQINESGKNFSAYFELPEQNHHQLEGLQFPTTNSQYLQYLLLESDQYHPRISKRYKILKSILDEEGISHISLRSEQDTMLGEALDTLQFGGYYTYYLGLLNEVDPAPNPYVDKFKKMLGTYS
ncbi:SIS domain-containing protein [Candidatus Dojkabacteria bacterium]|nr:SIS domain-containing protein [Candidatus Dojkabacteria bacterium]